MILTLSLTSSCIVRFTFHSFADSSPSDIEEVAVQVTEHCHTAPSISSTTAHRQNMAPAVPSNRMDTSGSTLALNNTLMGKFKPAKIFKGAVEPQQPSASASYSARPSNSGPRHITGISFDDRGDQVITAAEDETFRLYSCKTGK